MKLLTTALNSLRSISGKERQKNQQFFRELFGDALERRKLIELRKIHSNSGVCKPEFFDCFEPFFAAISKQDANWDYYFSINPRDRREGTNNAVSLVTCFWADLDFKNFEGGRQEAEQRVRKFPVRATVVIESGHGLHAYYVFKEPEEVTADPHMSSALKGFQAVLGSDPVADMARIFRVPGTLNFKNPDNPVLCRIRFEDYSRRCVPSDFEPFAELEAKRNPEVSIHSREIPEGKRNTTLTTLAGTMRRPGMGKEAIEAALLKENEQSCKPPLDPGEVKQIARSISHYDPVPEEAIAGHYSEEINVVCLADVAPEEVSWLWHPYLPIKKVTMLEGDPGVGKSWLCCALASAITLGHGLPNCAGQDPAPALIMTAEDGLGDTIRPRIDDLGGNIAKAYAVEGPATLTSEGIALLTAKLEKIEPRVVVIDPLVAYIGEGLNLYRANEIRPLMMRLEGLAVRFECAIVCVRHLTKSDKNQSIYRGAGSIDFTAAARSVLLAGCDPDNRQQRAIVPLKSNLAEEGPAIGYSIESGNFRWKGQSDLTAERILSRPSNQDKKQEAKEFLKEYLSDGSQTAQKVTEEAVRQDISKATLRRAREELRVIVTRAGVNGRRGGGAYYWSLPDLDAQLLPFEQDEQVNREGEAPLSASFSNKPPAQQEN